MSSVGMAALVLAIEFLVLAWAIPFVILRGSRKTEAREADDAVTMLEDVEAKVPARREALETIFRTTYQLEGDALDQRVDEFVEREQAFYEVMTQVYLDRDSERLKDIPEELTKVISPWIRLTPENMVEAAELDELATENAELQGRLDETRRNMDELMKEYMAAFNKEAALASGETEALPDALDEDFDVAFETEDEVAEAAAIDGEEGVAAAPAANEIALDATTEASAADLAEAGILPASDDEDSAADAETPQPTAIVLDGDPADDDDDPVASVERQMQDDLDALFDAELDAEDADDAAQSAAA